MPMPLGRRIASRRITTSQGILSKHGLASGVHKRHVLGSRAWGLAGVHRRHQQRKRARLRRAGKSS
jgi:hypothetical protein